MTANHSLPRASFRQSSCAKPRSTKLDTLTGMNRTRFPGRDFFHDDASLSRAVSTPMPRRRTA